MKFTILKSLIKKILPWKLYKLLANGFIIVPKYYQRIIEEAERNFDLAHEKHADKDIMLMRKYGHIIDKGLHRSDASPGHSKAIYLELKQLLGCLASTEYVKDPTYQWAAEKVKLYEQLQYSPESFQPEHAELTNETIDFEKFKELVKHRRSNRSFTPRVIEATTIAVLKDLANWAANSCNKQPINIFVSSDQELNKQCLACCVGGTGFGDNIPTFWCFTANVRAYVWPSEIYLPAIDVSLGAQNVFLAAQTLGITGTILSWGQHSKDDEHRLRNLLKISEEYDIIFCAVMGYASFGYLPPARKCLS